MTDLPRFFVPVEVLSAKDDILIEGDVLHHMQHVLRLCEGQEVELLDGCGTLCRVVLAEASRKTWLAKVKGRVQVSETTLPITLIQSLPKGDKFDLILQKGTELGVAVFQPVMTARTVARPDKKRLDQRMNRWRRIVQEAARQSRRNLLPEIRPLCTLSDAVGADPDFLRLALWEAGARPLSDVVPDEAPPGVSLLVGPEGGLESDEVACAAAAGFRPVHLGPRILRTETAGLAAAPVLQYLYGDWQQAPMGTSLSNEESR